MSISDLAVILSLIGGVVVVMGSITIWLISYIWKQRKEGIELQLAQGSNAFRQQEEFNMLIKKEQEKQSLKFNEHKQEFNTWKVVVSKLGTAVQGFSDTNVSLVEAVKTLSNNSHHHEVEIDKLKNNQ